MDDRQLKARIAALEFELAETRQAVPKVWIGVNESLRRAALAERGRIVEWLRSRAATEAAGNGFGDDFADWIESGSHSPVTPGTTIPALAPLKPRR